MFGWLVGALPCWESIRIRPDNTHGNQSRLSAVFVVGGRWWQICRRTSSRPTNRQPDGRPTYVCTCRGLVLPDASVSNSVRRCCTYGTVAPPPNKKHNDQRQNQQARAQTHTSMLTKSSCQLDRQTHRRRNACACIATSDEEKGHTRTNIDYCTLLPTVGADCMLAQPRTNQQKERMNVRTRHDDASDRLRLQARTRQKTLSH